MPEPLGAYLFPVAATVAVFWAARALYRRLGWLLLNPVLVSVAVLVAAMELLGVPHRAYAPGGEVISFFLGPAVVALGVPLARQWELIRRQRRPILTAVLAGSLVGVGSGTLAAVLLGAPPEVVLSIVPRSVTTPIAIGIAARIGGVPALSAALVIVTGILGAVAGPALLRAAGVRDRLSFGLALGAAAHGIGTARAAEEGEEESAGGGLAIGLMGVATAILAPAVAALLRWLG